MYLVPIMNHNVHRGSMTKEASHTLRKPNNYVSILYTRKCNMVTSDTIQ